MKLDMIGIITADISTATLFYERLGFSVSERFGEDYIELKNEGVRISLNTQKMVAGIYGFTPDTAGNLIELAFLCETAEEVDQKVSTMKSYGYTIFREPWNAEWGQRYAIIKDLDGNLLSLFANELK